MTACKQPLLPDNLRTKTVQRISYWGIISLAVPAALMCSATQIATTIDTAFYGSHLGSVNLAAFSVVSACVTLFTGAFSFLNAVVTSKVGKCMGRRAFEELPARTAAALGTALGTAAVCAGVLWLARDPLLDIMGLDGDRQDERAIAQSYFQACVCRIPLTMLLSACKGMLSGMNRVTISFLCLLLSSTLDVIGNYIVLFHLGLGLPQAGWATAGATGVGVLVSLVMLLLLPLQHEPEGRSLLEVMRGGVRRGGSSGPADDEEPSPDASRADSVEIAASEGYRSITVDFLRAGRDMLMRAFLIQGSLFLLTVAASRLGTATVAATQVGIQVWMLSSYLADGLETAGNILSSHILGQPRSTHNLLRPLTRRLSVLALSLGIIFAIVLWFGRAFVWPLFSSSDDSNQQLVHQQLGYIWWIVCAMQPPNAMVFMLDGLLYGTQSFAYVRNMLSLGFFVLFLPVISVGYIHFHTIAGLWAAKCTLNLWRFAFAAYRIFVHFFRQWLPLLDDEERTQTMHHAGYS